MFQLGYSNHAWTYEDFPHIQMKHILYTLHDLNL
jgi:hypothetical protein